MSLHDVCPRWGLSEPHGLGAGECRLKARTRGVSVGRSLWSSEELQESRQRDDRGFAMAFEREEMAVAGDNEVGLGDQSALQNPIIWLIFQDVEVRPRLQHRGGPANGLHDLLNLFV